jgi:D-arabinose 1-dehydrogenase-like Zn-dependent alcohol dehydrogenase
VDLIFGERKVAGSLTGNPATADATLRFSALGGVSAMIETVPLEEAPAAYAKMMAGKARFRMVLVTKTVMASRSEAFRPVGKVGFTGDRMAGAKRR